MLQVNVGSVYSSGDQGLASEALRESFGKHSIADPLVRPPMFWLVLERAKSGFSSQECSTISFAR